MRARCFLFCIFCNFFFTPLYYDDVVATLGSARRFVWRSGHITEIKNKNNRKRNARYIYYLILCTWSFKNFRRLVRIVPFGIVRTTSLFVRYTLMIRLFHTKVAGRAQLANTTWTTASCFSIKTFVR